ncbi:hypothetical protein ACMFMF_004431 [Clarireedia jacksonii]
MMTSISPVTMTSTIHTSELNDSSSGERSAVASLEFDSEFSDIFDIEVYSADIGSMDSDAIMNIPLVEFFPEIDLLNDDVRSAKALSPDTTSPSKSRTPDLATELASELSAAASSLSVPVIHGSETLPNCLQASVSEVFAERLGESQPSPNPSEASGVADDKLLESEPREADQTTTAMPIHTYQQKALLTRLPYRLKAKMIVH